MTWSISRDNALEACERRYFFDYVLRPRTNSKDARSREIAILKKLKTVFMWQGEVFHDLAANYLRRGQFRQFDAEAMLADALDRMRRDWAESAAKTYRLPSQTEQSGRAGRAKVEPTAEESAPLALLEHEYDLTSGDDLLYRAAGLLEVWFRRFLSWAADERILIQIRDARRTWIEPRAFGPNAPGFSLRGTQVVAKVDLAIQRRDERYVIFDWKTGIPRECAAGVVDDDAEYQVTVYQLWPHLSLGAPLDAIEAHAVFVGADPVIVRSYTLDEDTRERALRRLGRGVRRGLALHGEGDHAELSEADFDLAGHPALCRWCGFKRICQGAALT